MPSAALERGASGNYPTDGWLIHELHPSRVHTGASFGHTDISFGHTDISLGHTDISFGHTEINVGHAGTVFIMA